MSGLFFVLLIGFSAAQLLNLRYDQPLNANKQPLNRQNLCFEQVTLPVAQTSDPTRTSYIPETNINNRNSIDAVTDNFENFNSKLYQIIAREQSRINVVYSPISLQTLLAFVYTGSHGNTAYELQRALALPQDKTKVANLFQPLLQSQKSTSKTQLIMANKMYYDSKLRVKTEFRQRAQNQFNAEIDDTRFDRPEDAARKINRWIAEKTNNHIENLIAPYALDANTQSILVNAIYFKAKWSKEFSTTDTAAQNFQRCTQCPPVPVEMMYNDDVYRYGEFPELKAKILEMPYNNSDLSMMIILPNEIDGLQAVEQELKNQDLTELASRLKKETVTIRIPKFRVEFEVDMVEPLMKLGIKELFTTDAKLDDFFENNQQVSVSKVQHKAFIDVNEAGSEAAAASFVKIIPLSLPAKIVSFTVDHPFVFAIRGPQVVYFIGHVVNF